MYRQALLERAVENLFASLVVEIRDQDCVLFSQSTCAVVLEVGKISKRHGSDYQRRQREHRTTLVAFDLTHEVLRARCRSGRLFVCLPARRLTAG